MFLRSLISMLALTFFMLTQVAAQSGSSLPPTQESKEEQQKARQELERKAVSLLDSTLESAQTLKLAENRAMVQATAADLLWTRDEKRARNLFRDAMTAIADTLAAARDKANRYDQSYWMVMELRRQTLQMIARHDPQLALDQLHSTRPEQPEGASANTGMPDEELTLEQSIADQVAATDPKLALQLAQESLAKGISFSLLTLLMRLREKDPEAASRLVSDIVKKLQAEQAPGRAPEAAYVGQALLHMLVQPQEPQPALAAQQTQATAKPKPLKVDDETLRNLAGAVASRALSAATVEPNYLMMLQPLLPELEKRVPELAAQIRKRIAEVSKSMNPESKEWLRTEAIMRNGTTDEMLEAAAKASPQLRNNLYITAALKLLNSGEGERARQIISDNVTGPERDQMLLNIDQQLMARAIEQGKLDEAKQLASHLRSKTARATELAQLAAQLFVRKNDRKTALQLLGEAQGLLNRQPDSQEEMEAVIQLARAYALIEPSRAFELVEPLVDQANQMLSAAALLEKFGGRAGGGQSLFKKGELLMQPGLFNMDRIAAQYSRALVALARADFDRARNLADKFDRSETRILAHLLIAQSILSERTEAGTGQNTLILGSGVLIAN